MYISRVQIQNFRNFENVDVPINRKTILLGENNSGKSNLMRALTLPLATSEIGNFRKTLEWDDINKSCKKKFFEFINNRRSDFLISKVTQEEFIDVLPFVSVILTFTPDAETNDVFNLKYLLTDLTSDFQSYTLNYRFYVKDVAKLFERIKQVVTGPDFNPKIEHNLLPIDFFVFNITAEPEEKSISYTDLQKFRYSLIPAERDEFSSNIRNIGSKLFVNLLTRNLTTDKTSVIENAYNDFFDEIRKTATVGELINWQNRSLIENAKEFFSELELQPNMPTFYSILNSAKLGLKDGPLSGEGLGHRNLLFLCVLVSALTIPKEGDSPFSLLLIDEVDAHLSQTNQMVFNSYLNSIDIVNNKNLQIIFDTHSLNFIEKENLTNIVVLENSNVYAFCDCFDKEELNYLSRNPNLDIYNFLFAKRVILVEGPSEELLLRAYRASQKDKLHRLTILSFHKGYRRIIEAWKKINSNSNNKLAVIRDYDDEPKARTNHESLNSNNVKSFTTKSASLESEIAHAGGNYKILNELFSERLAWVDILDKQSLVAKWKEDKLKAGLLLAQEISAGLLPGFELPPHIADALKWLDLE